MEAYNPLNTQAVTVQVTQPQGQMNTVTTAVTNQPVHGQVQVCQRQPVCPKDPKAQKSEDLFVNFSLARLAVA